MVEKPSIPMTARLGFLVYRLHLALREAFEERLTADGISPADWGVLAHVWEGVDTPADLADRLGVNRAAVTRTLDRLETAGLVARTPNAADGRSLLVSLTATGKKVTNRAAEASELINSEYTVGLTATERDELLTLLCKTVRSLPGRRRTSNESIDG